MNNEVKIKDKFNNTVMYYTEPIYMKRDGFYGYLIVDVSGIKFIYHDGSQLLFEDLTEYYEVIG